MCLGKDSLEGRGLELDLKDEQNLDKREVKNYSRYTGENEHGLGRRQYGNYIEDTSVLCWIQKIKVEKEDETIKCRTLKNWADAIGFDSQD